MEFSLPSRRRALRFLVVFYAVTALLFFAASCLLFGFLFGPKFWALAALLWPVGFVATPFEVMLIAVVGLATALAEPRVTGVLN